MGRNKQELSKNLVTKRERVFVSRLFKMIGITLYGFVVLAMTSIVAGRDIVDRETTDSYEALELLQMSTIHDLVKTLTSKVDGITSKVNTLTSKVDRNSGQIVGIVNALDAKIKNLSP